MATLRALKRNQSCQSMSNSLHQTPAESERLLVESHKADIDQKLRELCAILNVALDDGFHTNFQLNNQQGDNRYFVAQLILFKQY